MKKKNVKIGRRYIVKVSGRLVPVRIDRECQYGGWYGTNTSTGCDVRIRTAARLRWVCADGPQHQPKSIRPIMEIMQEALAEINEKA